MISEGGDSPYVRSAAHGVDETLRYGYVFCSARGSAGQREHEHVVFGREEGGGMALEDTIHIRSHVFVRAYWYGLFKIFDRFDGFKSVVSPEIGEPVCVDQLLQEFPLNGFGVIVGIEERLSLPVGVEASEKRHRS